jgi:tetratricopeptide (TPR) repeat protein
MMRSTSVALLLVSHAAWALAAQATPAAEDAQRVFANVAPSVVTVKTRDDDGQPDGHGSGVVVGKDLVVTNCHVVRRAASVQVVSAAGELAALWTRQLPNQDACLLAVKGLTATPVPLRTSVDLALGEPVYAIGNPLGFGLAVSSGLIGAIDRSSDYTVLLATAPVSPGSSGGGLFDRDGKLLGITTAIMGTGQNFNRILSAEVVADLLRKGEPRPVLQAVPTPEKKWPEPAAALLEADNWEALAAYGREWSLAQPTSALALVYQARAEMNLKHYAAAHTLLEQAQALDDRVEMLWTTRADLFIALNRDDEVDRAFRILERLFPYATDGNIRRSERYARQGKPQLALDELKQAIRKYPSRSSWWSRLGRLEEQLNHPKEAAIAFATALRLGSADTEVQRRLAALSTPGHAVGSPPGPASIGVAGSAPKPVRPGARSTPESEALVALGWSEHNKGRHRQAEEAARQALVLAPKSANAWNLLGGALFHTGRAQEAEAAFTNSLETEPEDTGVLVNRGDSRRAQNKFAPALADVKSALALDRNFAPAHRLNAILMYEAKDLRAASAAFARANELTPLDAELLSRWAECLVGIGDVDTALVQIRKAEAMPPVSAQVYLAKAKVMFAQKDMEGALASANKALELAPSSPAAWSSKGYALMKVGRLPEAVQALETSVRLGPELTNGWVNLGEAQMLSRNLGPAIAALEKALALSPESVDARHYLSQCFMAARLYGKSREMAEITLARHPNFPPAMGMVTLSYLLEGNVALGTASYVKLKAVSAQTARAVRDRAVASNLAGASELPQ